MLARLPFSLRHEVSHDLLQPLLKESDPEAEVPRGGGGEVRAAVGLLEGAAPGKKRKKR